MYMNDVLTLMIDFNTSCAFPFFGSSKISLIMQKRQKKPFFSLIIFQKIMYLGIWHALLKVKISMWCVGSSLGMGYFGVFSYYVMYRYI